MKNVTVELFNLSYEDSNIDTELLVRKLQKLLNEELPNKGSEVHVSHCLRGYHPYVAVVYDSDDFTTRALASAYNHCVCFVHLQQQKKENNA